MPNTETVTQITDTNQSFIKNPQITHKYQSLLKFLGTMKEGEKVRYRITILVLSYAIIEYSLKPRWGLYVIVHTFAYFYGKLII